MNRRLIALKKRGKKKRLDGFIITHLKNIHYLVGFTGSNGILYIPFHPSRDPLLMTDFRYKEQVKEETHDCEIKILSRSLWDDLAKVVKRAKHIGFESFHMIHSSFEKLRSSIPNCEFIPTEEWVEEIRMVKDREEIERIRRAQEITDQVFQELLPLITPGRRERDVAMEIEYLMRKKGASGSSFETICASGPRSALPHARAGTKRIQKGDFVTLDMGAVFEGYCSDMTRTVFVGKATESQKKVYGIVLRAHKAGLRYLKPRRRCADVDRRTRGIIKREGYGRAFGHGTGHGVGLEVHELPVLYSKSTRVLKRRMVVTVEPGIYLPKRWGVRIEDLVLIRNEGYEILSKSPKKLMEL